MRYLWTALIFSLLTACSSLSGPQPVVELPTLAELPTLPPTLTPAPSALPTNTLTATLTLTASVTPSPTVTVTPSATITDTPTPTFTTTATPTPRQGALFLLLELADQVTVLPPELRPVVPTPLPLDNNQSVVPSGVLLPSTCAVLPPGGFGTLFVGMPALAAQLGCPVGVPATTSSAEQRFERGTMIWLAGPIYALYNDGRYQQFSDSFMPGIDPERGGELPPAGLIEPIRGFGKVWRTDPMVRAGLGWGITSETGGTAVVQRFERGWMIDLTQQEGILLLIEQPGGLTGNWQSVVGNY
jgi:hypothetical protein